MTFFENFKILAASIIVLMSCSPLNKAHASYTPVDGRITYLAGLSIATNFQEQVFNDNDTHADLGRSQSYELLAQALGDLNSYSSLIAEVTFGTHKFCKETNEYVDDYILQGITFDLGYRRHVFKDFWVSGQIGSLYPWNVRQRINSAPTDYDDHEFDSIYSVNLGIHYESELDKRPVSYALKIKKFLSSKVDDQMSIGLSFGWRFGTEPTETKQ